MNVNDFFTPVKAGGLVLPNRIVMAPMTRSRADDDGVPTDLVPVYYAQRASAGLIITEGAFPSAMGKGYVRTPGIATPAQVEGWKKVTRAVHARGGRIVLQIMHAGRISHPLHLPGGAMPVAPSAVRPEGQSYTVEGLKPHPTPRALETAEIPGVIAEYARATERALAAGFDGVELHAASGYLPEQFLSSKTNRRTDAYGGSVANRARFVLEALEAMSAVAGGERVGVKIAPELGFNDIADETPRDTYAQLVKSLRPLGLAYLHVVQTSPATDYHALLRPLFEGAYFAGGSLTRTAAGALLADRRADAAVFGKLFLANPDLPQRFRLEAPLNEPDPATFYTPGPEGYVDYPSLRDARDVHEAA
ncbi:1,2-oxophytodienoate reductase [Sulfurifustis variabilis]|uniref:1,2-oxophytodienoate reductase n=1 Tax=Sulfurifustis variabilis TaxID=1675686 RepID=A0A1B4V354_9GAMM|nr:alkene reductase [Sulfurifustis variabilis]BAU47978.1 1,2-oxophytodienoate reductase [Sulfurifustis variabilis]